MGNTFEPLKLKLRVDLHELLKRLHSEFGGDFRVRDAHGSHWDVEPAGNAAFPMRGLNLTWNIYLKKTLGKRKILVIKIETVTTSSLLDITIDIKDKNYTIFFRDFFDGFDKTLSKYMKELNWRFDKFRINFKGDN